MFFLTSFSSARSSYSCYPPRKCLLGKSFPTQSEFPSQQHGHHLRLEMKNLRDFPGGPVVKTLRFHCRGHELDP